MLTDSVPVVQATPIDVLHDDVLIEIFDFHVTGGMYQTRKKAMEAWQSLVHVCRRWRCIVFGSPRRLNLRLVCTPETPVRESLDVWPALPLIVVATGTISSTSADNIVAALGYRDRVCQIRLPEVTRGLEWEKILAAMQAPFPALTGLLLGSRQGMGLSILPDTFLGGSAPRLRYLDMDCIPFPGIPNLLLSATHLGRLDLSVIPSSGYVSPKAMATSLSELTRLHTLHLSLEFPYSRSHRRPPPMTRSILPGLTTFGFTGPSKYLDGLVKRIDAPRLDYLSITFPFDQLNLNTPHAHLVQFISRTPGFQEPNEAHVALELDAEVRLLRVSDDYARLRVKISYEDLEGDPEPSSIAQLCAMCLPPLPTVENLRLEEDLCSELESDWKDNVETDQWLELLRPFTAIKNLYLSEDFQPDIASALQELVGGRTTEVLPSLQNIFLANFEPSGSFQEAIGQFVAARQLSGHPILVLPL